MIAKKPAPVKAATSALGSTVERLGVRLRALFATYLSDNRQAWDLGADGVWVQREPDGPVRASHELLQRNSWGGLRDALPTITEARRSTTPAGD